MGAGSTENRRASTVAAVVAIVVVGALVAYLGFRLADIGAHFWSGGGVLIGLGAIILGLVLIGLPVAVLVSQLLSVYRRHG